MRYVRRGVSWIVFAVAWVDLAAGSAPAAPGRYLFSSPVYDVPGEANFLAAGDFNGDGRTDVAVANTDPHDVSIFLGDGRGGLLPGPELAIPDGPLAAADFDRDGLDDLVVSAYATNELVVALSRGDGTFDAPLRLPAGAGPQGVVAADFDGDGNPDLAVADFFSDDVSVFLGRGDGTFAAPVRAAAGHHPTRVAAGRLDGDTRADLAVVDNDPGAIAILIGAGDGTFAPGRAIADGAFHRAIVAADLDGDGRDELATANNADGSVYPNHGDGTFGPPTSYAPREDLTLAVALADVTGDRKADLVLGANGGTVFPGNGDGTFGARRTMGGGFHPYGLAVADFDGDGIADLATSNGYRRSVTILHGNGDGTSGSRLAAGAFPLRIRKRDLNGDGRMDLLVLDEDSADISVFFGADGGGFEPGGPVRIGYFYFPVVLADGDFDGDGQVDLAVGTYGVPVLALLHGRGDGTFDPSALLPASSPGSLEAGDVNGDGLADLVESIGHGAIETRLALGKGSFGPAIETETGASGGVTLADFNRDGVLDVAEYDFVGNEAVVLLGNGDGSFRSVWSGGNTDLSGIAGIVAGDVDGDRVPDLILTGSDGGFAVSLGAGDGTFGPPATYWTNAYCPWAAVADFNLDGIPDVAVPYGGGDVGVFVGTGGGALELQGRYDAGDGPSEAVVGDFDDDGRPDLAIADAESNLVSVLYDRADRPPHANAGPDQVAECEGLLRAAVRLDGSASTDADSSPGTHDDIAGYLWSEGGAALAGGEVATVPLLLGVHDVVLEVTDAAGATGTDDATISVVDTEPPRGSILAPAPGSCFGPAALPVTVTDDFTDSCDPSVARRYDPAPGPSYAEHGDHRVTVSAADGSGNAATALVEFTIDTKPPAVSLIGPADGALLAPSSLPLGIAFQDGDDDGAAGGVVHEVITLQGCAIFDGLTYGNRDGLLSDETVTLGLGDLCRAAAACGFTSLDRPELRVEATDCGGNVGVAARRFSGSLALRPGICGR